MGGKISLKPWKDDRGNIHRTMLAWGKLTRDPDTTPTKKKGLPRARFTLSLGKDEFLGCTAVGESPTTALGQCLEKGDVVVVFGEFTEEPWVNSRNESGVWQNIKVDVILPQQAPQIEAGPPDAFETAPDDYDNDDYELNM